MEETTKQIEVIEGQATGTSGNPVESSIIPDSFMLGGLQIEVQFDPSLCRNRKVLGEARYPAQQIVLDPSVSGLQQLEQAYYHELTHWILFIMNETDLRNNEKFVDLFAHFLYQARVTEGREVPGKR